MTEDDLLLARLRIALGQLWEEGSPVVGSGTEQHQQEALLALRRWRSFDRRNRTKSPSHEQRVEDLAKGLRDAAQLDRRLVGRLMADYRYVAHVLATTLKEQQSDSKRSEG